MDKKEIFISVDIETSGPIPGEYSIASIGACLIYKPEIQYECLLKPTTLKYDPGALAVTGFTMEYLEKNGLEVEIAMKRFNNWVIENSTNKSPIFVGFNAAFDWSFINYYFIKFMGANPFGFTALDVKSMYFGMNRISWSSTKSSAIDRVLKPSLYGSHNALQDALYQAELFRILLSSNPTNQEANPQCTTRK